MAKSKGKTSGKGSKKGNKKNTDETAPEETEPPPLTNLDKFNLLLSCIAKHERDDKRFSLPADFNTKTPSNLRRVISLPVLLPSYKYDLSDLCQPFFAGVPAFKQDSVPDKPHVCLWQFFTKDDAKTLLELDTEEKSVQFLGDKFSDEPDGTTTDLLFELLLNTLHFARAKNMTEKKTAAYLSIVYLTHNFFRSSLWHTAQETYDYAKEMFLLHTVVRPPKSAEIFDPEECRAGLTHFCKTYLRYLPLVQLAMLPNHRLHLEWEPEPPPPPPKPTKSKSKVGGKSKKSGKGKKGKTV